MQLAGDKNYLFSSVIIKMKSNFYQFCLVFTLVQMN